MEDLPEGWSECALSAITEPRGEKVSPQDNPEMIFIGMDHVEAHSMKIIGRGVASEMKSSCAKFYENDVIYGRLRAYLNKVTIPGFNGLASAEFIVLPPGPALDPKFLAFRLNSRDFVSFANHLNEGDRPRVSFDQICVFRVKLPPLVEQKAIVNKIEALFSELDHGVEQLEAVRAQLKRYRQAVLKAAFEGKLTADWRAEQQKQGNLPTADELLAQIKQERTERYEQQLAEWKQAVKNWEVAGCKDSGEKKPRKQAAPRQNERLTNTQLSKLSSLPEGWGWHQIGELFSVCVGSTPSRKNEAYWQGEVRWISSGEVAFKDITDTREKITQLGLDNTSTSVHPGGSVIIAMIGEGKTRGQAAIMRVSACNNQNTAVIRVSDTCCIPEYVYYMLMMDYEKNRLIGAGNNQKALNRTRVEQMHFSLCSVEEQTEIVSVLDTRLSIIENLEQTVSTGIAQADALRQSILKKAFKGRLICDAELDTIRSDTGYEPADQLLIRIREEREKATGSKSKRGRKKKTPHTVGGAK